MNDSDEPAGRRTEGVRIIGAQEAAEAAGRPDVVRRRRGGEKRYGDRPDRPQQTSDLPKITISTTEAETAARGAVGPDEEYPGGYGDPSVPSYGHARIIPASVDSPEDPQAGEPMDPVDLGPEQHDDPRGSDPGFDDELEPTMAIDAAALAEELEGSGAWAPDPRGGELDDDSPEEEHVADDDTESGRPGRGFSEPPSFEPSYDPALLHSTTDPGSDSFEEVGEGDLFGASAEDVDEEDVSFDVVSADPDMGIDDDDSFVLPHWTEPPTGQVPKVVIEDIDETDSLATYGSQPRWRDGGEREGATDFDDLIDDGPRLGALAGGVEDEADDFFSDGPYTDTGFIVEDDLDAVDDDGFEDFGPDETPGTRPAGRPARPRRRSDGRGGDDDGGAVGGDRPLGIAVGVGVLLVAVGLVCFWLGGLATTLLATVVVTVAAFEYFTAVRTAGHNPATLLGLVAVAGLMLATFGAATAAYPVVLGLTVMSGLLWFLWVAPGDRAVPNLGLTLLGVAWVGFLGSFATLFLGLGRQVQELSADVTSNPGIGVLIAAVIATVAHDVGAYFSGKLLGRTPLSAASPNKTQEGLIGGVLASLVVTFVVVGVVGVSPIGDEIPQAFLFALLCAVVAPLGDLCESFVKRDLGVKDMGSVLPGHGGVLDRFDALLFVLPTAYFVTILFDVWGNIAV